MSKDLETVCLKLEDKSGVFGNFIDIENSDQVKIEGIPTTELVRRKDAEEAIEAAHTRGVEDAIEIMEMAMEMSKSELEELISRFGESTGSNKTLKEGDTSD